jgi:succinate dehydrogenase/fumarate reductase flavoprotein subunit
MRLEMNTLDADVVVVGFGSAGQAAAITAHDAGAKVLILEKAPEEHAGGNGRISGQAWFSPYDPQAARRHLRAMAGGYPVPDEVIDALAEEAARNNDWVSARIEEVRGRVPREDGDPADPADAVVTRIPYSSAAAYAGQDLPEHEFWDVDGNDAGTERNMISGSMGFARLWNTLAANIRSRGIQVRYGTGATGLIRAADGSVTAVRADGPDGEQYLIRAARAVVIATGGFAASHAMTANYLRLPDAVPWGSPYNTGDGIRMAQGLGADLAHPYNYMSITGIRLGERRQGEHAEVGENRYVHVGADGQRFVNEALGSWHGKTRVRGTFDFYPGVPMWTIFDEDGRLAGPIVVPREQFAVGWPKQVERYVWSADNSAEIEKGWIVRANTIRELAEELGIDPGGLEAEIARYNDIAARGIDDPRLGRPAASITPIRKAPFYGYRWAQLLITTLGGLRKDGAARVLDSGGQQIPRLYSAGEVASSYPWLVAGGLSLGDCLAFGRIAGRNAAAEQAQALDAVPQKVGGAG